VVVHRALQTRSLNTAYWHFKRIILKRRDTMLNSIGTVNQLPMTVCMHIYNRDFFYYMYATKHKLDSIAISMRVIPKSDFAPTEFIHPTCQESSQLMNA
jgi:hypothetical protein